MELKPCGTLLVGLALVTSCTRSTGLPPDFRPDNGDTAVDTSRKIRGSRHELPLAKTGFRAVVSLMHYADQPNASPEFCFIAVEQWDKVRGIGCFERQLPLSNLPPSILTAPVKDLVSFDSARRLVTFKLGPTNYTYTLPRAQ